MDWRGFCFRISGGVKGEVGISDEYLMLITVRAAIFLDFISQTCWKALLISVISIR